MPDSVGIVFRFRLVKVHNLVVTNRDLHGVGIKPIPCPWTFGRSHSDRSHIHETTSPPCFDPHIINHTTVGLIRHECDSDIIVARGEEIKIVRPPSPHKSQTMIASLRVLTLEHRLRMKLRPILQRKLLGSRPSTPVS